MRKLEATLGVIAAVALFAMMALTFTDVIGRKLLNASIFGGLEVTELLMLVLIFVALPLTSLNSEHVMFDLLDPMLPARFRNWQRRLANLFCTALLLGASWLVLERAARTLGEGDVTAQLRIPVAPFHYAVAALLLFTALVHLVLALRASATSGPDDVSPTRMRDD